MSHRVTRERIAGHVAGAFAETGTATKKEIVLRAQNTGGDQDTLLVLLSLPDRTYASMRELWTSLPDLPIE